MEKNLRIFFAACLLAFFGLIGTGEVNAQATLEHSYTFEDGTAADVVGGADGTPTGGFFGSGVYVASEPGNIIALPAADIAINEFEAITLEAFITATGNNAGTNTMLAYFGGSPGGLGANGYFMQLSRADGQSRTAISTGNTTQPWTTETGVFGAQVDAEGKHHLVSILTDESISWYIDGVLAGTTLMADDTLGNTIAQLSNEFAWLAKGGYSGDPTWRGIIHEFNIYEGVLDAAQITEHAEAFLEEAEPTLSAISVTVGEETIALSPDFHPYKTTYSLRVPPGTSAVNVDATASYATATVTGTGAATLVDGSASPTITVATATDTMSYTVEIKEISNDASLAAINAIVGQDTIALDPVFASDVKEYNVEVPSGTTSVTIRATPSNSGAGIDGTGNLDVTTGSGKATLLVTAEDGTEDTYTVNVLVAGAADNANLDSLAVAQPGMLTPAFDPEVTEYSYVVEERGRTYVNVVAIPEAAQATIDGGDVSRIVEMVDGVGTATIIVTAVDGTTTKEYTINITEADAPTAVGDELDALFKVYPTVSAREFTVEFAAVSGKITVYDLSGKLIIEKAATSLKASVSLPKAGMYIMRLESKGQGKTFRVFKVK